MPEFFLLDEVAHHQACNFIKKRLQRRCFTVNFAKFLKAPSRTPPVNASAVNATFLIHYINSIISTSFQPIDSSAHWSGSDLTVFNTIYLALT